MSLNSTDRVGEIIRETINTGDETKQVVSDDESTGFEQVAFSQTVTQTSHFQAIGIEYAPDSFIIDHPVQCDIDSAILKIDGGYDGFEYTFPFTFTEGTKSTNILYETTF